MFSNLKQSKFAIGQTRTNALDAVIVEGSSRGVVCA